MKTHLSCEQLEHLKSAGAVLLLFGGAHCGVCQAIKPKLAWLMAQRFPEIELVYVDCSESPDMCAQHRIFSLPVVHLYIEGRLYLERGRSFSLVELGDDIGRTYALWKPVSAEYGG
jgi:thiol-disulfide isomerase/thioredoxin